MKASFPSFVAIRLVEAKSSPTAAKAMRSFLDSLPPLDNLSPEEMLSNWVATMIDRNASPSTRRRYLGALSSLYKEYFSDTRSFSQDKSASVPEPPTEPEFLSFLRSTEPDTTAIENTTLMAERLRRVFGMVVNDASHQPEIALFLHMLLNASSDLAGAISLTTDQYEPVFPQLDSVIDPASFHHRRRYVFDLGQSRKRMPQLSRETLAAIDSYLMSRGVRFPDGLTPSSTVSLWIAMARKAGIPISDIRAAIPEVPSDFSYLSLVPLPNTSNPTECAISTEVVKLRVAEAFLPSSDHWHAMKLRRGTSFADISGTIADILPDAYHASSFFYPERQASKKVGKRIVTETVPVLPDIVFFRVSHRHVAAIDRTLRHANMAWVFRVVNTPDSDYSVIDNASMLTFERAVGQLTPDMTVALTDKRPLAVGRMVRITGGVLSGYRGTIYDIKPQSPSVPGSPSSAPNSSLSTIYIRLSSSDFMKIEVAIPEEFIEETQ